MILYLTIADLGKDATGSPYLATTVGTGNKIMMSL